MIENELLTEIYRTRETIARENGCDAARLVAHFREVAARLKSQGWNVSLPSETETAVVRAEPPAS